MTKQIIKLRKFIEKHPCFIGKWFQWCLCGDGILKRNRNKKGLCWICVEDDNDNDFSEEEFERGDW